MNLAGWPFMDALSSNVAFDPHDDVDANLARFVAYCLATSLGWDLGRAVVTVVLTLTLGATVLKALATGHAEGGLRDPGHLRGAT